MKIYNKKKRIILKKVAVDRQTKQMKITVDSSLYVDFFQDDHFLCLTATEGKSNQTSEGRGYRPNRGNRMFRGGPRFFFPMHRGMMAPPFGPFGPGRPPFGAMRGLGPMPPPHIVSNSKLILFYRTTISFGFFS